MDSDTENTQENGQEENAVTGRTGTAANLVWAFVVAVLVLSMLAMGWFLWRQAGQIEKIRSQQHGVQVESLKQQNRVQQRINEVDRHSRSNQQELDKRVEELKRSIITLRKLAGRERQGWVLSEVEYLLLIANHRLKLEKDIRTAIEALRQADERLKQLADPRLMTARKHIADEIIRLRAVKLPDISGMMWIIDSLTGQVAKLALFAARPGRLRKQAKESLKPEKKQGWRGTVSNVWGELKTLVVIRRRDKPIRPMLLPEQDKAFRQILELKLQTARIALMRRQTKRFTSALDSALAWLRQHYDVTDTQVIKFMKSLAELKRRNIDPKMPDISASLEEVRYQLNRGHRARKLDVRKPKVSPVKPAANNPEETDKNGSGSRSNGPEESSPEVSGQGEPKKDEPKKVEPKKSEAKPEASEDKPGVE